jgi:hypothetical protein
VVGKGLVETVTMAGRASSAAAAAAAAAAAGSRLDILPVLVRQDTLPAAAAAAADTLPAAWDMLLPLVLPGRLVQVRKTGNLRQAVHLAGWEQTSGRLVSALRAVVLAESLVEQPHS